MNVDAVLWALGIAVTVLLAAFGYVSSRVKDVEIRVNTLAEDQSKQSQHFAENYVRGHEIAEVKKMLADLRTEVSHQISELTKAVYQMVGQSNNK